MKPLSSLKVLDLTIGNPYVGKMFSDYGAEVIKIEKPGEGDPIRRRGNIKGDGEGPYSSFYMRGKKSVAIDFTKPEGAEIIKKLAEKVDMIAFSTSEEKNAEYGLSYEDLKRVNPKIVYGVLTPFGEEGPWKDIPDYDLLVMSKSGLLGQTGMPEKPTKFGFPFGYIYASWHLTAGMLAALLKAEETGEGMKVSCSAWQTVVEVDDTFAECLQGMNVLPKRIGNGFPTTNPTDTFKCKDGWFSLSIGSDKQWLDFVHEAGMDDKWGEGTVYAHDPVRSEEHYFGELDLQLIEYFKTVTIEEADFICRRAMVPGGPCNTVEEIVKDEQFKERGMLIDVGGETQIGFAAKFLRDTEGDDVIEPAHELGADTEEYLKAAGIDEEKISGLRSGGIL